MIPLKSSLMSLGLLRCTTAVFAVASLFLTACSPDTIAAASIAKTERNSVDHIVVRYELGAPPLTDAGTPWGSQCVSRAYVDRVKRGRWIGAGMRVIRLDPPTTPTIARVIATQFTQCPYIEWAEADDTRLVVPPEDLLSG